MAYTKFSELADGAPAQASDQIAIARAGDNYRLALSDLADFTLASEGGLADFTLASEGGLAISTSGTVEEVLRTVTIPAGAFNQYAGVEIDVSFKASGATNNKTVRTRLGGIGGTAIHNQTLSTNSNRWWLRATLMVQGIGTLLGNGFQIGSSGTTSGNIYTFDGISVDFDSSIDLAFTGQSTVAGELTLNSVRVKLLPSI